MVVVSVQKSKPLGKKSFSNWNEVFEFLIQTDQIAFLIPVSNTEKTAYDKLMEIKNLDEAMFLIQKKLRMIN